MDFDKKDMTLEQSMKEVMKTLPPFIREYLAQGKYTTVAQGLMSKYKLRIDQGGVLERELLLLLMGIEDPAEFTKALIDEANIVDRMTVNSIVKDINEQVFIPLRKQEEELSKGVVPEKPKPAVPQAASRPAIAEQRTAAPAPHIAPLPPKMAMPGTSGSLGDVLRSVMKTLPSEKPSDTSRLLEDHEEPHIELKASAAVPVAPVLPKESTPINKEKTPNVSPAPKIGQPQVPKQPPTPPITSYPSDPYREPIDEF